MVRKVVLTGGPCAGKTSVMNILRAKLDDQAVFVEEAATQVFTEGQEVPVASWSPGDWMRLQRRITVRQLELEAAAVAVAEWTGREFVICDRAPCDNTAYPQGNEAVAELMSTRRADVHARYAQVFHLESLATAQPDRFSQNGNTARYETLAEAQDLELRARAAWLNHPHWVFLAGRQSVDELATSIIGQLQVVHA